MQLKELSVILTIAKHRSITNAAKELFVTQPALSMYLNNVETQLGTALFDRQEKPIKLTPAGELYVRKAKQIMLIGAFVELCRSIQCMNAMGILRGAGAVKFAMFNDILFLWLFTIPAGCVAALVLHWPVAAVYVVLKLDQFLKIFTSGWKVKRI